MTARGLDVQETFTAFRPDFDLETERERQAAPGKPETFGDEDLYPDARACLTALKNQGVFVGMGRQPAGPCRAEPSLRALDLSVDVIGTSHSWGVGKPAPVFSERGIREGGGHASAIVPTTISARPRDPV